MARDEVPDDVRKDLKGEYIFLEVKVTRVCKDELLSPPFTIESRLRISVDAIVFSSRGNTVQYTRR